jgi:hypothetical protein
VWTVNVSANASDDKGVSKVDFYIDSALKSTDSASPYNYSWNTSGLSGTHTIYAKAYDTINQVTQSATITVTVGTAQDPYEPNNTFAEAYSINSGTTYSSYIYSSTDNDYYKFNVTSGQAISVSMTPPSDKDYDIKLYNPSQSQVAISQNGTGSTENINYSASATGNYYVNVYGYNGTYSTATKYNLIVTISTGTGATVTWGTKPKSGTSTTVTWTNSLSTTHTNIHYGTNPDPRTNYSGYTTAKTGSAGTFSNALTGTANYYYVVHSIMNGIDYYSSIVYCSSTTGSTCAEPVSANIRVVWVPKTFELEQNYPNPFNPETFIRYQLPREGDVKVNIYNTIGQLVTNLVDSKQFAGVYMVK